MALGAFHFEANDSRKRFLFIAWGGQQVRFWTAAQRMTLNGVLYQEHRDLVRARLGRMQDFIRDLPLG